ncbi:MAG: hypothetical protein HQ515_09435, partial [Phycisphaeraceae bacterium]|nr:hypothetical protein [Phycisphaeraceae bacterium]
MRLVPGDQIQVRFKASNWHYVRAYQASVIENRLEKDQTQWFIRSADYWTPGELSFVIQIKDFVYSHDVQDELVIANVISRVNPLSFPLAFLDATRQSAADVIEIGKEALEKGKEKAK